MNFLNKLRIKQSLLRHLIKVFFYDAKRFYKYATTTELKSFTEDRLLGYIITRYHIIEKGLSMPEMRLGFGLNILDALAHSCKLFYEKFGSDNDQVNHAVNVLSEYMEVHIRNEHTLDYQLLRTIELLQTQNPDNRQLNNYESISGDQYFPFNKSHFPDFALSRHSLRHFSNEPLEIEILNKALLLAQKTTPTSCNRQSIRIHLVSKSDLIKTILNIQTGNRGFGHLADKLIVLSSEVSVYNGLRERNMPYIDSGLYAMNLLYALHYYEVGTCALNWGTSIAGDKSLRSLLSIKESEIITLIIICGKPAKEIKLATSKRRNFDSVTKYYIK